MCQTCDLVLKDCNVGQVAGNSKIVFLFNPVRTELYLLMLISPCVMINSCQHLALCCPRCSFIHLLLVISYALQ